MRSALRLWVDPPVRDHLPAPDPRLRDGHRRFGACRDPGHGHPRDTSLGSPARSLSPQADPDRRQSYERARLRRVCVRRPAVAGVRLRGRRRCRGRRGPHREPDAAHHPGNAEQRAASFALGRVASNLGLGLGSGATVAGFIVASAQHLRSFQTLYLFDAITYAALALIVLAMVPHRRAVAAHTGAVGRGFRAVARDRRFLIVIAVNIVLVIVGYTLSTNILPPFVEAHTRVGPCAIGILFLFNTSFIVIAQLPATRVVKRMRRAQAFARPGHRWRGARDLT